MITQKNNTQLFVVAKQTPTSGLEGTVIDQYTDLKDGEVAVCNALNTVLDGAADGGSLTFTNGNAFKLIGRVGTKLIHSDLIKKGTITSWRITGQSAEVQQVDYIGSNGTTGSLDAVASNLYTVRLYIRGGTITDFMQQKIKEGFYKSNTAAASYTQSVVADNLVKSLIANFSREPEQEILFNVVSDSTETAVPTGAGTIAFTKGSTQVVFGTAIDDSTGTAALVVGDWITIATTGPLYKIESIDVASETATLTSPYQETTVAAVVNTTAKLVRVADAAAGNWGIKLTGVDRAFAVGKFDSLVVEWKATIDFGDTQTTTVNETTSAYPGIGTAQQVAKLEKELQSDEYEYRSFLEGAPVDRQQVTAAILLAGTLHDMCVLEYYDSIDSGLGNVVKSPKTIIIAGQDSTNLSMSDANQGVAQTIDEIVELWEEAGDSGTDQDGNLT